MTYKDALAYLESLIRFGIKLDLERFRVLCAQFGDPQNSFRSIHIAGTNGKGSTTAIASSILRAAGLKVGSYLSPYVHDLRERVLVNGEMISKDDFAELMGEIIPHLEAVAASDLGQPTEFEAKTLLAFLHFARKGVDIACVEVGMGGRFDATNVLDPLVSVITNVSLDHTERLGDTVEKIAFEKAGIIKPGRPVVTAAEEPALGVIQEAAAERGCPLWRVREGSTSDKGDDDIVWEAADSLLSITARKRTYKGLRLGLKGSFQYPNAACAVAAVEFVDGVSEEAIHQGLAEAYIPGRLEVLRRNPTLVIDGAHNPAAAACLAEAIRQEFKYERLILVVGMLSTHSAEGFLSHVAPLAERIIATAPDWPLARPAEELAKEARAFLANVSVVSTVRAAVDAAIAEARTEDLVLVTGSFYTIGELT